MGRMTDKEGREEFTVSFIKDKQSMYVLRNIEALSPSHRCSVVYVLVHVKLVLRINFYTMHRTYYIKMVADQVYQQFHVLLTTWETEQVFLMSWLNVNRHVF